MLAVSLAFVIALHPFAAPSSGFAQRAIAAAPDPVAEPSDTAQPGWDDPPAEETPTAATPTSDVPPPTVTPATAPPPASPLPTVAVPPPGANAKPNYRKGTGLIIGASITGGLGWIAALTRLAFVKQCENALREADTLETGVGAGTTCIFRAGVGNVALIIPQYTLNAATWGLAAGAGAVRGRYDGVEDAWSGKPSKKTGGFIGAGAAILAVGVVGRITAAALVGEPVKHLQPDASGHIDAAGFASAYRARLVGVQLSSAMIGLGAGLLAYGVSYRKHHREQNKVIKQVRIVPDLNFDPTNGMGYGGVALSGRF
jgi:hypothetical protein